MSNVREIHVVLEMDAGGTKTQVVGEFYETNLALDQLQALADTDLFYSVSIAYLDERDDQGRLGYRYIEPRKR